MDLSFTKSNLDMADELARLGYITALPEVRENNDNVLLGEPGEVLTITSEHLLQNGQTIVRLTFTTYRPNRHGILKRTSRESVDQFFERIPDKGWRPLGTGKNGILLQRYQEGSRAP